MAENVREISLCMAACSVALAITIALRIVVIRAINAFGSKQEETMRDKSVHQVMARRIPFLCLFSEIGAAAVGGLLAS